MSDDNDFPKLDGGWCDGMGCGKGFCFCTEHLAMCEDFQRTYNKPWKQSYDENPDIDCDRVEEVWRHSQARIRKYYEKEMGYMQDEIDRLKGKLETFFIVFQEADGQLCVKRCEDDRAANAFLREKELSLDNCKVISGGYILSRQEPSKMWFYKRAENK